MTESGDVLGITKQTINIYTWAVYGVLCQLINLFGIVTNIINIICFTKQGFQDSVNISFTALALSDLGSVIAMFLTCFWLTPAVATADLPFEPFDVMYLTSAMVHMSFTRVSSCITAMITLERCLCITYPLKIKSLLTPRRTTVITVSLFLVSFWSASPVWAVNRLEVKFSTFRNKTIVGLVSTANRENIETISFAINNFCIPFGAFTIIVVCTTILSFQLRRVALWRLTAMNSSQVDKVTTRNQKTAKMVVMVSNVFIVCYIPVTIVMLALVFIPGMSPGAKYLNIATMIGGIGYVMENLNSSVNIFIYYYMSSKYRECFCRFFLSSKVTNLVTSSAQAN